jgi:hypothetical protein
MKFQLGTDENDIRQTTDSRQTFVGNLVIPSAVSMVNASRSEEYGGTRLD